MVVDVVVGVVALADGTVSVLGEPGRVLVWSVGLAALVASVALLVVRHQRADALAR